MRKTARTIARITATAGTLAVLAAGCSAGGSAPDSTSAGPSTTSPPSSPTRALSWEEQAGMIGGIVNFREERPEILSQEHQTGAIEYDVLPPVGGVHNDLWMNCEGDVYPEQVPNEHAVHSLEHGAVWVTYQPDLPGDQVAALARRVEGSEYLFMSPFPDLLRPISLQAWGYQLQVDDAADPRIDEFIQVLARNASPEGPGAPCGNGRTTTGTEPGR